MSLSRWFRSPRHLLTSFLESEEQRVPVGALPSLSSSKIGRTGSFLLVCRRVVVHWRAIILLLILARIAFLVAHSDEFLRFELIELALLLIFIASQIFWIRRLVDVGQRFIPGRPRRVWLVIMVSLVYLLVLLYSYPEWGLGHIIRGRRLPAAAHPYLRGILVVVRGIAVGLSLSDCFRGGRPGGPCSWMGLPQNARGYAYGHTPALRRC